MTPTRSAVVTGAASGIGRAIAMQLATDGWNVVAGDIDGSGLQVAFEGSDVAPMVLDVTEAGSCVAAVSAAGDLGPLGAVVCCAGLERHGSVVTTSEADWHRVLDVNLTGVFLTTRAAIPAMAAGGGGSIVIVSSTQALATQPNVAAYAASKGALLSLTRAMALDHAPDGVRVNCVAPGTVDTPLVQANAVHFRPSDPAGQLADWGRMHALGRIGTPGEVAEVVAFLASERASFVTGATWVVDGGLLASF